MRSANYLQVPYSSNVVSYGGIHTELTLSIELKRNIDDNEVTFINTFKENPSTIASVTHFITDKEKYIWGSDNNLSDEEENSVIYRTFIHRVLIAGDE